MSANSSPKNLPNRSLAIQFILLFGLVSALGDITYETGAGRERGLSGFLRRQRNLNWIGLWFGRISRICLKTGIRLSRFTNARILDRNLYWLRFITQYSPAGLC